MPTAPKKSKTIVVPGAQPVPDPVTARPVTVPKKKTAAKKPAKTATLRTEVAVIIDKSGSMMSRASDVIGGFNQYIDDLNKGRQADSTTISVTLFDTQITKLYKSEPLTKVAHFTEEVYRPFGLTALLDAIGQTVTDIDKSLTEGTRVLVVIMTDGQENSSREYQRATIRQMIRDREAKGNWTFVFMGADQDAFAESFQLGISAGNTLSHKGSDYMGAIKTLNVSTQTYARAGGQSCSTFFTPDQDLPDRSQDK